MPPGVVPASLAARGLLVGPLRLDLGQLDRLDSHVTGAEGVRIDETGEDATGQRPRPVHLPDTHTHAHTPATGRGRDSTWWRYRG